VSFCQVKYLLTAQISVGFRFSVGLIRGMSREEHGASAGYRLRKTDTDHSCFMHGLMTSNVQTQRWRD
jgi:hypothetical protein